MAGFTSRGRTVGPRLLHPLFELAFVRIRMATGTVQVLPVIYDSRLRLDLSRFLVAVGTRHSHVPACKNEARLLVFSQAKG